MYRIEIDRSLCSGFGSCAEHAPDSLSIGADGLAAASRNPTDEAAVIEAAAACPMGAIAVYDDTGKQIA
jgi:ferredoxin